MLISTTPTQLGCCEACSQRKPGMGFTSSGSSNSDNWLQKLLPLPVDNNWIQPAGTIALAAIAVFLAYKVFFGSRATNRRKELAAARKDYTQKVASIRERYAL
jgi:hypothetical protein